MLDEKFEEKVKQAIAWRRTLHEHPQTSYEEVFASDFIASKLQEMGIEVHRGLAETGVVGIIEGKGGGNRAVGIRADIDALNIEEKTGVDWHSKYQGKMHACGHDGHTAMLLCAASHLAQSRDFSGTCYLIFQPAEEGGAGGRRMMDDGLFEKFPMESVWGLHNWPGKPEGWFGVCKGAMMASADIFHLTVRGKGGHAAMPHDCVDPICVASQIIIALQSIVSRKVSPQEAAVISVTTFHSGSADNIIPEEVRISGTVRTLAAGVRDRIEAEMARIIHGIAGSFGAEADFIYDRNYPTLINTDSETDFAASVARQLVGEEHVVHTEPVMGGEDFAFMLQEKPGSYIFMGIGEDRAALHSPYYDFNDNALALGARYWIELVQKLLPQQSI